MVRFVFQLRKILFFPIAFSRVVHAYYFFNRIITTGWFTTWSLLGRLVASTGGTTWPRGCRRSTTWTRTGKMWASPPAYWPSAQCSFSTHRALPFNVAARYNEHPPTRRASIAFRAFLALDAVAFVSSAVATFRSAILHNGALNARLGTGAFLRSLLNDNSRMFCRFCRRHSLFFSVALALVAYCVVVGTTIFLDRI